ncbi:class I SAM-dependent methyltransferase [Deinococcus maricopensis]|nr:methyltransferase [Deinococcus maricopensis]
MTYFDVVRAGVPPRLSDVEVRTKAGVRGAPGVDDAQVLLVTTLLKRGVEGPLLDLTAMGGLTRAALGADVQVVEASRAALTVLAAQGFGAAAAVPGDDVGTCAQVSAVLAGDRGNAHAEALTAWAHASTAPGGTLYLAGDKDKGFERYFKRARAAFGAGEIIARDGGMRVAALTRTSQAVVPVPAPTTYEVNQLQISALPGVFSSAGLDFATQLLLGEAPEVLGRSLAGLDIADYGCGAGVIGAHAARAGAHVTMLDDDLSAVRSAQATLAANGLAGRALHSDVDSALDAETFDAVLSNPPFHVGRRVVLDVTAAFIASWGRRLRPGGVAVLVANDFLPYEPLLAAWGTVEELTRVRGFKVLAAQKA